MKISADDFARQAAAVTRSDRVAVVRAAGQVDLANSTGRIIRYLFSDPSVARDNHTIASWETDNFLCNPVFLWAHDMKQPPIGKVVDLSQRDGILSGSVEYMEREVYPFADTIFQMVKRGYLNATSTSWDPLKWRLANDRSRPGGIDFDLVDLMEISQVPVPALPTALATARANGIDTGPIFEWAGRILDEGDMTVLPRMEVENLRRAAKMPLGRRSASKTLYVSRPVVNHDEIRTWMRESGFAKSLPGNDMHVTIAYSRDEVDWSSLSVLEDEITIEPSDNRTVAPLGDKGAIVLRFEDDTLFSRWQEIRDAGASWDFAEFHPHVTLTYSGAPEGVSAYPGQIILGAERFAEVNSSWADEIAEADLAEDTAERSPNKGNPMTIADFKRSIHHVSWLAGVLSDLDCVQCSLGWEKKYEESETAIPDELMAIKAQLGAILVLLVGEEVAKMLEPEDGERSAEPDAKVRAAAELRQRAQMRQSTATLQPHIQYSGDDLPALMGRVAEVMDSRLSHAKVVEAQGEADLAIRQRRAKAMKLRLLAAG